MQLILGKGKVSMFSRTGDDIAAAFPDIVENVFGEAVLDGELLVGRDFEPALVQRPAAAPQPQGGDRRNTCRTSRPSSASTTCCSTATRTSARCLGRSGGSGSKRGSRATRRRGSTSREVLPFC